MSEEEKLKKQFSYEQYCDIATSAWLMAEEKTGIVPDAHFRRQLFQYIDDIVVNPDGNKYSLDKLLGKKL